MATPALITLANFAANLTQSTQGRAGTPDGNIFFDQANDLIELITASELSQVDLGSGLEDNPLTDALGIQLQALYAFERQERGTDTALRTFLPGTEGRFQDAGAFAFANGVKLAASDRNKVRGSGWTEFANDGGIDRIYFGPRSLNNVEATTQPYVQIVSDLLEATLQAAAPTDANELGPLDEAFQVFGSTGNTPSDAGAGNFDNTADILIAKVRTFGFTQGEATSTGSGANRLQAFSLGFGVGEAVSPVDAFTEADVLGGGQIAPWTGMTFRRETAPITRTGFNEADGDFTDTITNTAPGSLLEMRAFMDAIMRSDNDENANTGNTGPFRPKRADVLYTINSAGQLVTRQGLYLVNIPTADQQGVILTDDAGAAKTFPFQVDVRVSVSDAWFDDVNAWYSAYIFDGTGSQDFDTATAVILEDAAAANVVGTPGDGRAAGVAGSREVRFTYDYSGNTQAGLSGGTDREIMFLAEGDGGAVAARARFTITEQAIVTASAQAAVETNI